jgi:hypothetical protein
MVVKGPVKVAEPEVTEPVTGVWTMTVPVESVPAGPRVTVVGAVPVPAWVMVVKGPVNVAEPVIGVWTMTVPVESVPAGPRVTVVGAVPVPAWVIVVKGPVKVTELGAAEPEVTEPGVPGVTI